MHNVISIFIITGNTIPILLFSNFLYFFYIYMQRLVVGTEYLYILLVLFILC